MWYAKSEHFKFKAYTDADWAGSLDDKNITSGATFFLGKFLVSWVRKKQASIYLLNVGAEYIFAIICVHIFYGCRKP